MKNKKNKSVVIKVGAEDLGIEFAKDPFVFTMALIKYSDNFDNLDFETQKYFLSLFAVCFFSYKYEFECKCHYVVIDGTKIDFDMILDYIVIAPDERIKRDLSNPDLLTCPASFLKVMNECVN